MLIIIYTYINIYIRIIKKFILYKMTSKLPKLSDTSQPFYLIFDNIYLSMDPFNKQYPSIWTNLAYISYILLGTYYKLLNLSASPR